MKDNISCEKWNNPMGRGYTIDCVANGVITDLAGKKSHWSSNQDEQSWDSGKVTCHYSVDYRDGLGFPAGEKGPDSLTCDAARQFDQVENKIVYDKNMQSALSLASRGVKKNERAIICYDYSGDGDPILDVFAIGKANGRIYEIFEDEDGGISETEWANGKYSSVEKKKNIKHAASLDPNAMELRWAVHKLPYDSDPYHQTSKCLEADSND